MITRIRDARIKREGSPYFSVPLPSIAAGAIKRYDCETDSELAGAPKYLPLDWIEVTNNDNVDVELQLQTGDKFLVAAGAIKEITRPFRRFTIKNLDSTTATTDEKIRVTVQRQPVTVEKMVRKFFG